MNAPNRFELYVLGEGEQKLTVEEDTKIPNAATLTINKEDHTLAGMLRSQLLMLPSVLFAGYKVPHPLEPRFIIKIQTTADSTPVLAVQEACKALIVTLSKLRNQVISELETARTIGASTGLGVDDATTAGGAGGQNALDEGLGGGAGGVNEGYDEGMGGGGFGEFIQ